MHESQCQTPQQVKLSAMHPEGLTHQRVHVHCMASLTESESLAVDQKLLFLLHSVRTRAIMPQTCSDSVHSCGCYSYQVQHCKSAISSLRSKLRLCAIYMPAYKCFIGRPAVHGNPCVAFHNANAVGKTVLDQPGNCYFWAVSKVFNNEFSATQP